MRAICSAHFTVLANDVDLADDVACFSPLSHEHINLLGRYDFILSNRIAAGKLRLLRSLADWEEYLAKIP